MSHFYRYANIFARKGKFELFIKDFFATSPMVLKKAEKYGNHKRKL
jgi:hypothetical protein